MRPLVKWNGGLEQHLETIRELMPRDFECYFEPYMGSGAVYFSMEGRTCYVNDRCRSLMNIYKYVQKESRPFRMMFKMMSAAWKKMDAFYYRVVDELADIVERNRRNCYREFPRLVQDINEQVDRIAYSEIFAYVLPDPNVFKMELRFAMIQEVLRMEKLVDLDDDDVEANILTALKLAIYLFVTEVLNNKDVGSEEKAAALAFILNYSADVPFKKDTCREYRLPFGGKKMSHVYLAGQCRLIESEELKAHFAKTTFGCMDALDFLKKYEPAFEDFVLLDPPDEVKRAAKMDDFTPEAGKRLAKYLLKECDARWMLLLKPNASSIPIYKKAGVKINPLEGNGKLIIRNY